MLHNFRRNLSCVSIQSRWVKFYTSIEARWFGWLRRFFRLRPNSRSLLDHAGCGCPACFCGWPGGRSFCFHLPKRNLRFDQDGCGVGVQRNIAIAAQTNVTLPFFIP